MHRGLDASVDRSLDSFLDASPTSFAQQTTSWRSVITEIDEDDACFLICKRDEEIVGLLPMYRFVGPRGTILTSVPQPGPLGGVAVAPQLEHEDIYSSLLTACFIFARSSDCDLVSIITNPFWPDHETYRQIKRPDFVLENSLLALDLCKDVDVDGSLLNASTSVRRNLRIALDAGLVIDEEQTEENVDCWASIHQRRHEEIGATPLPHKLFRAVLRHAVAAGRARFFFVRSAESGEMVSGGLYLCHGSVVDAYMPSMDSRYAELRPNYLLAAHSIAWARRGGHAYYNWQGSPPRGGVERFKRSFGSQQFDYRYLTWVTGDAKRFLEAKVSEIRDEYRFHYVLPFDQLGASGGETRTEERTSARRDAWGAMEQGE